MAKPKTVAKKATKKTAPKKVAKKTATKRTYTKKAKVAEDVNVQVEEQLTVAADETPVDARDTIIAGQRQVINELSSECNRLEGELLNPSNVGRKLALIDPVVYLDFAQYDVKGTAIEIGMILHILGRDGYVVEGVNDPLTATREQPYGTPANLAGITAFSLLMGSKILRLNTVNRTASVSCEKGLPEGTELVRITANAGIPKPVVEAAARTVSHTHTIDGVVYRRSY